MAPTSSPWECRLPLCKFTLIHPAGQGEAARTETVTPDQVESSLWLELSRPDIHDELRLLYYKANLNAIAVSLTHTSSSKISPPALLKVRSVKSTIGFRYMPSPSSRFAEPSETTSFQVDFASTGEATRFVQALEAYKAANSADGIELKLGAPERARQRPRDAPTARPPALTTMPDPLIPGTPSMRMGETHEKVGGEPPEGIERQIQSQDQSPSQTRQRFTGSQSPVPPLSRPPKQTTATRKKRNIVRAPGKLPIRTLTVTQGKVTAHARSAQVDGAARNANPNVPSTSTHAEVFKAPAPRITQAQSRRTPLPFLIPPTGRTGGDMVSGTRQQQQQQHPKTKATPVKTCDTTATCAASTSASVLAPSRANTDWVTGKDHQQDSPPALPSASQLSQDVSSQPQQPLASIIPPRVPDAMIEPLESPNLYMYDYDSPAATQIQTPVEPRLQAQTQDLAQMQTDTQMETQTQMHTHPQTQSPAAASFTSQRDMQNDDNEHKTQEPLHDNASSSSSPLTYAREFANPASNVQKTIELHGAGAASDNLSTSTRKQSDASTDTDAARPPPIGPSDQPATQPKGKYVRTEEQRARMSEAQRAIWARRKAAAALAAGAPAIAIAVDDGNSAQIAANVPREDGPPSPAAAADLGIARMQIDEEHRAVSTLSVPAVTGMLLDQGSPAILHRGPSALPDARRQPQLKSSHASTSLPVSHEPARFGLGQLGDGILAPDSQPDGQRSLSDSSNRPGMPKVHMRQSISTPPIVRPNRDNDDAGRTSDAEEAHLAAECIDIFEVARQLEARLSEQEILDLAREIVLEPGFLETCRKVQGCHQLRMLAGV